MRCDKCGIRTVSVPWARPESGFTLLFEAMVMTMVSAMPVKAVARMVGEHDTRLWRVVHHYVDAARARLDALGCHPRRHRRDRGTARPQLHHAVRRYRPGPRAVRHRRPATPSTIAAFADDLAAHGGDPDAIAEVCIDMSPAFIKGVGDSLPNAAITFDKFHAVKIVNEAVDAVRRAEQKGQSLLRGTRYIWLRNPDNLSERQRETLDALPTRHLKTGRAYQIRLAFQDLYDQPSTEAAIGYLKKWYFWATHSRLDPMIEAARTIKRHWDGILRWFDSKIANGLIEGINTAVDILTSFVVKRSTTFSRLHRLAVDHASPRTWLVLDPPPRRHDQGMVDDPAIRFGKLRASVPLRSIWPREVAGEARRSQRKPRWRKRSWAIA